MPRICKTKETNSATLYLFFISLVFFIKPMVSAQSYIPTIVKNRTWDILEPKGHGQFCAFSVRVGCDTIIDQTTYTKVHGQRLLIVREDTLNHKIYLHDKALGAERLLIDYDISVDSVFDRSTVDSVTFSYYFGQIRKVIHFDDSYKWIEGVGDSFHGIPREFTHYARIDSFYLGNYDCVLLDYFNVGEDTLQMRQVSSFIHFYDPTKGEKFLSIYNIAGQLVQKITFNTEYFLDLLNYSEQLLILEIISEKRRIVKKVLTY
jgi:hypothetical protein